MADLVENTASPSRAASPVLSAGGAKPAEAPRSPLWFLQRPAHAPVGPVFARPSQRSTLEPGRSPSAQLSLSGDGADAGKTENERPRAGDPDNTKLPNASDGLPAAKTSGAITRGAAFGAMPDSEVRASVMPLAAAEVTDNNAQAAVLNESKAGTGAAEKRLETGNAPVTAGVSAVVAEIAATTGVPSQTSQARTLEDTVVDLLRPMLKQWLDTNMPRIVEKALRVELAHKAEKTPS
jgi:cell pole-organizing protein PopZ